MIQVRYTSPWEASWTPSDRKTELWLKKLFTFTDTTDLFHKKKFGHFPQTCYLDTVNYKMTHGQVIQVMGFCQQHLVPIHIDNAPPRYQIETGPIPQDFLPGVTARDYQTLVTQVCLGYGHGIVKVGTGGGKTLIMGMVLRIILERTAATGVMVMIYSKDLLNQTAARFAKYGVPLEDIGIVHSDISAEKQVAEAQKRVVLTTHRSIVKFPGTINKTEYILCDEAHESIGPLWSALFAMVPNLKNVLGFTATPWDDNDEYFKMSAIFGQILVDIPIPFLVDRGYLMKPDCYFIRLNYGDRDMELAAAMSWQQAQKQFIFEDSNRNLMPVVALKKFGGRMLVLYENLAHGEHVSGLYQSYGFETRYADGSYSTKERDAILNWFAKPCEPGEPGKVLVASRILDQGIDLENGCDNLFILGSCQKPRRNKQRIGRALRLNGTNKLRIFDFYDSNHKTLARWSASRKGVYKELGFNVQTLEPEDFATLK